MPKHWVWPLQVVASIHQPNSQITECFDDLLLLAGGRTAYFGPWQSSMAYFASVNFACPMYTNPSDHYLLILKESADYLVHHWADSPTARANLMEGLQGSPCSAGGPNSSSFGCSWVLQAPVTQALMLNSRSKTIIAPSFEVEVRQTVIRLCPEQQYIGCWWKDTSCRTGQTASRSPYNSKGWFSPRFVASPKSKGARRSLSFGKDYVHHAIVPGSIKDQ